jgi:hypothetical protein
MLGRNFKEDNAGRVGLKWWRNFIRQNKCHLSIGKAVRFDMKRTESCKSENFSQMYDVIYVKLEEKGLAEKWEEQQILDKEGSIVMDEKNMYGRPTTYNLTHPEKMIFVDEVGDNTSQANDRNKTGTSYVTGNGLRAHHQNSFTDFHYTTLGPLPPESRSCAPLSLLLTS